MKKIVNLTPHELTLVGNDGEEIARIAPSGQVARVNTRATVVGSVEIEGHSVPIVSTEFGEVVDLPEKKDGTTYVVSILVAQAVRGQRGDDVVAPDTGPQSVVRDAQGQIKGVRRFTR